MQGADIFSNGGQFSFDCVSSVAHDPNSPDRLLMTSKRAIEVIHFTPDGPALEVKQLGVVGFQKPQLPAALPIAVSNQGNLQLQVAGQNRIVPAAGQKVRAIIANPNWKGLLPLGFQSGHRAWVIEPDGISWLETDQRWHR